MKARDYYFASGAMKHGYDVNRKHVCKHGHLARSCETCELREENRRLREQLQAWLDLVDSGVVVKVLALAELTRPMVEEQ